MEGTGLVVITTCWSSTGGTAVPFSESGSRREDVFEADGAN